MSCAAGSCSCGGREPASKLPWATWKREQKSPSTKRRLKQKLFLSVVEVEKFWTSNSNRHK